VSALIFHPAAKAELVASIRFYEAQTPGLGDRFLEAVEATGAHFLLHPNAGSPLTGGHRKRIVSGFPYSLIYDFGEGEIYLVAVAHHHRRPDYWRSRPPGG
jgi:plasmid stabilization system protein ParE